MRPAPSHCAVLLLLACGLYVHAITVAISSPWKNSIWTAGDEVQISMRIQEETAADRPMTLELLRGDSATPFVVAQVSSDVPEKVTFLNYQVPANLAPRTDYYLRLGTPNAFFYSDYFTVKSGNGKADATDDKTTTSSAAASSNTSDDKKPTEGSKPNGNGEASKLPSEGGKKTGAVTVTSTHTTTAEESSTSAKPTATTAGASGVGYDALAAGLTVALVYLIYP
ncbi:hypothetical protein IWQ60_001639 [Tieghemiomyces parasiticus]|uniref:Yeast cell wall synthesis Kre9/Knh1-like N-terminal domain-containing protein n=1 Tax=Tieghemiomyces parasiticus TaxID=78921 RepID=A0A9W8AE81_9FUNG|nr:hypothetical protein IWQ60_001639 [Tieghemiomyces parasiticus]